MEKLGNLVCLDSDILVDFLRNVGYAVEWIRMNKDKYELGTTIINLFELYAGAYVAGKASRRKADIDSLASYLRILPLSLNDVQDAGREHSLLKKKGFLIGNQDVLVGIMARNNGAFLRTNNKKHFGKISGLKLL
ncbi:MAG: type II toxin-antitoxin system VapC family toxin [Candidatus Pacearchaeota archaeon]